MSKLDGYQAARGERPTSKVSVHPSRSQTIIRSALTPTQEILKNSQQKEFN
jgi:hypothetical protein